MRLLFQLGSNPELSKKEVEAVAAGLPFSWKSTLLRSGFLELACEGEYGPELLPALRTLQDRLGGTLKILRGLDGGTDVAALAGHVRGLAGDASRFTLGLSVYGRGPKPFELGMQLKRQLAPLSLRYVPAKERTALSTAQTWHNKLDLARFDAAKPAAELSIIEERGRMITAVTLTVQNVDEYARRDFGIPAPDAVSGMLPPKLAQIMINLALGSADPKGATIYDPFCGNGRILLEGWAMGSQVLGSDLDQGKVAATAKNLDWLGGQGAAWQADATKPASVNEAVRRAAGRPLYLVTEPYLGKPLRQALPAGEAADWLANLERIYLPFLEGWAQAPEKPEGLLVVFPAAQVRHAPPAALFAHLFDRLEKMGYRTERLSRYARPDAVVARDIVLLTYR